MTTRGRASVCAEVVHFRRANSKAVYLSTSHFVGWANTLKRPPTRANRRPPVQLVSVPSDPIAHNKKPRSINTPGLR